MILMKNKDTGLYVQFITGEEIGYTRSRLDAFDLVSTADKEDLQKLIKATNLPGTDNIEFVEE